MKNLQQHEWRAQLAQDKNSVILDVRTKEECASGIIENAIMIDFLQPALFMQEIERLDKSKNYYVYCRSGNRSGMVAGFMSQKGFSELFNLADGIMSWTGEIAEPA